MIKIENWCVGCRDIGLPCMGQACPQRNVEAHYCDRCGCELEYEEWRLDNEYCAECRAEMEDEINEEV